MKREPALILGAISALLNLLVGFGLDWTANQITLVNVFAAAVVALVVRANVTPVD